MPKQLFLHCLIPLILLGEIVGAHAQQGPAATQITYDGSLNGLPGHTGTPISKSGTTTTIPQGIGATSGNNLFHSFGLFDIANGDTADFTGAANIANIVARVTGGQQSDIYGTLKSSINQANLYLMNPAGVFFGQGGSVDVTGSFHVSTADYLEFSDGSRFLASTSPTIPPVSVNPVDFGFLTTTKQGNIEINSTGLLIDGPTILEIVTGDLSLVNASLNTESTAAGKSKGVLIKADNFLLQNSSIGTSSLSVGIASPDISIFLDGNFSSNRGFIGFGSSPSSNNGSITISANNLTFANQSFVSAQPAATIGLPGSINLIAKNKISLSNSMIRTDKIASDTAGVSGGINITASYLTMQDSAINSDAGFFGGASALDPETTGAPISIDVTNDIVINNSSITTDTLGSWFGGTISIRAGGTLFISNQSNISSNATVDTTLHFPGNAGSLIIDVGNLYIHSSKVSSNAILDPINGATFGVGNNAGIIIIKSENIDMNNAVISSTTSGEGNAGNINIIQTAGILKMTNGSAIRTDTTGTGDAGNIIVKLADVTLDASEITSSSTATNGGSAGIISLTAAEQLNVKNGSKIATDAADADAGKIDVTTAKLSLNKGQISSIAGGRGASGNINLIQPNAIVTATNGSAIRTDTTGTGNAGDITLDLASLSLDRSSQITSSSNQAGSTGTAGQILIRAARDVNVSNQSLIATDALRADAGDISITGSTLRLNQGEISSTAGGSGASGNIILTASGLFSAVNGSTVRTDTTGTGLGGSITVDSGQTLLNHSQIRSNSTSTAPNAGQAGNILVKARSRLDMQQSTISTNSQNADGGNIDILVPPINQPTIIYLVDSEISTSAQGGTGSGGNIFIDPTLLILDNSRIAANAFGGPGGNITIITDAIILDPDSAITASSGIGVQGTINISSPDTNALAGLTQLPSNFFDTTSMINVACKQRSGSNISHFVVRGRGGMPSIPGDLSPGFLPSIESQAAGQSVLSMPDSESSIPLLDQAGSCAL